MNRSLVTVVAVLALGWSNPAQAAIIYLGDQDVSSWKLENYPSPSTGVNLWNAPTSCSSGHLTLPSTASSADHDRLWSLITTAKLSGKHIFVYYDNASPNCTLISFGLW